MEGAVTVGAGVGSVGGLPRPTPPVGALPLCSVLQAARALPLRTASRWGSLLVLPERVWGSGAQVPTMPCWVPSWMGVGGWPPLSCSTCALTVWGEGLDQPSGALRGHQVPHPCSWVWESPGLLLRNGVHCVSFMLWWFPSTQEGAPKAQQHGEVS